MAAGLSGDRIGPVDVALISFEGNRFNGDVAPALKELVDRGDVRVLDLVFLIKEADGSTAFVEVEDAGVAEAFAPFADDHVDLLGDEEMLEAASELAPGSSALMIVWENTWAARFATAVRESHGEVVVMERIPHEDVLLAISALSLEV